MVSQWAGSDQDWSCGEQRQINTAGPPWESCLGSAICTDYGTPRGLWVAEISGRVAAWPGSAGRGLGDPRTTTDSWASPDCSVSAAGPAAAAGRQPARVIRSSSSCWKKSPLCSSFYTLEPCKCVSIAVCSREKHKASQIRCWLDSYSKLYPVRTVIRKLVKKVRSLNGN